VSRSSPAAITPPTGAPPHARGGAPPRGRRGPSPRAAGGQATVDYAAVVTVVALVLAGAGAAAASASGLGGVPRTVAHTVRIGLCMVGGDVCRSSDAAAAGLSPCLTSEDVDGEGLTVTILSFDLGGSGSWSVARRSDGSVLVTRLEQGAAGVTGGVGVSLGSLVTIGAAASYDLTLSHGRAWELPSTAAAAQLIAAVKRGDDPPRPTWVFGDAGGELAGSVGVAYPGGSFTALEASAGEAAGARVGRGQLTTYVRVHAEAGTPLGSWASGATGTSAGPDGAGGPLLLGVTRDAHGLRELSFRRAVPGAHGGEVVETVGRLDLRDPANLSAARPLLAARTPWPPAALAALHAVLLRTSQHGTVERAVYAVDDRSHDVSGTIALGAQLGLDYSQVDVTRRLVDASAWTAGSPERRRADCLPSLA
jgi:hypothetical protein